MSRTDKTAPWWVQADAWVPRHACHRFHRACDLPAAPPRNQREASWRGPERTVCGWEPRDWHKITFSRYNEDWMHDSRARTKRAWKRDQGI